ncbi:hypothetical protein EAX61_16285 [Dokdonia sinensis]|uniref:Uncharacterized protein n=1 Tax=Dokdonia sinensis TaxID=2479847 RepID=A0A3M0GFE9_9FLAO|nr:hypothetical protein [Dokdonia sinensis]RMB56036.1 hypothetical protein EAX61_16285 [Dokdonia sinensis]
MKLFTTIGILLLTFVTVNAQQIDIEIYQVLKTQGVLTTNQNTTLISESENQKIYQVNFNSSDNYDKAILIDYGSNNFEFIYDSQMGQNSNKIIISKNYSSISKTQIDSGCGMGECWSVYKQYHNGRKLFEKRIGG